MTVEGLDEINAKLGSQLTEIKVTKSDGTEENIPLDGISCAVGYAIGNGIEVNNKLGSQLTEIKVTKPDGTEENIPLDGISGAVIAINNKLGPQVNADTELPWSETLSDAGIGVGGIVGLSLLAQSKLGPQISSLNTYTNIGGNGGIITPQTTQDSTGGIGGGIQKINDDWQADQHENDKRDKLNFRANLIDLLN